MTEPVELHLHGFTHGGEAVGRLPDGKACFVPYAIPGERVLVRVVEDRRRWARAQVVEVIEASADRVDAPCPLFGPGKCGGCRIQHIAPARQAELLRNVVADQLQRIGKIESPPVAETVRPHPGDGLGYRNRARFAVDARGRLGFRRAGSHDIIPVPQCPLLEGSAKEVRAAAGDAWHGCEEVVVRAGRAGSGPEEGLLEVRPATGTVPDLHGGEVPLALIDALGGAAPLRGEALVKYEVAGMEFLVSATSFFQASVAGAEELARLVREGARIRPDEEVLDLYAGVGLFSRVLAADGARLTAVEGDPSSSSDARENLAGLDPPATVVQDDVAAEVTRRLRDGSRTDVVVLDPPRKGAEAALCRDLADLGARTIVYVSCDPAALARDARALTDSGYPLTVATPVDQFTHTAHVETVAVFDQDR